jgi:hypothetical protein
MGARIGINDAIGENVETMAEENGESHEYLTGWALISLAAALMGSGFMLALDNTILGMIS